VCRQPGATPNSLRPKSEAEGHGGPGAEPALIRRRALDLLARREHSVAELRAKLLRRGHGAGEIAAVLSGLEAEGLLSDARFAESYVAARRARGEGPLRIATALRQRGVAEELIARYVDREDAAWQRVMEAAWRKRFGGVRPRDFKERARQARFLLQRGFAQSQVMALLKADDTDFVDPA